MKKNIFAASLVISLVICGCAISDPGEVASTTEQPGAVSDITLVNEDNIKTLDDRKNETTLSESGAAPGVFETAKSTFSYSTNWGFLYAEDGDAVWLCDSKVNEENTGKDYFVRIFNGSKETIMSLEEIPGDSMVDSMYKSGDNLYFMVLVYERGEDAPSRDLYAYSCGGDFLFSKPIAEFVSDETYAGAVFPDMEGGIWITAPAEGAHRTIFWRCPYQAEICL